MENNELIKICQASHITGIPTKNDKIHYKIHPKMGRKAICTINIKENNHLMRETSYSMEHNQPMKWRTSTKRGDDSIK